MKEGMKSGLLYVKRFLIPADFLYSKFKVKAKRNKPDEMRKATTISALNSG